MKIVWFSWKDIFHPSAGGAEVISNGILTRLARDGNSVILLTARYDSAPSHSFHNGYHIRRAGGRLSCYFLCLLVFLRHHTKDTDRSY